MLEIYKHSTNFWIQ